MKEHIDGLMKISRTINNSPIASKQMFKLVDNRRTVVQRAAKEIKEDGDLDSLTFEQLSYFESQRISKEAFGQCVKSWGDALVIKDDENPAIWDSIKVKYAAAKALNAPVLYELMTGTAYETQAIVYPGLDSCLGITVTKADATSKKGTHLVQPNETTVKKYLEQLQELKAFFAENDNVHIACKEHPADINSHRDSLGDIEERSEAAKEDAKQALEIFDLFYLRDSGMNDNYEPLSGFTKKEATVEETPDVNAKYNANTIHTIS